MPAPRRFEFSRRRRLITPGQFQSVFANARRSGDRYFTVLYQESGGEDARIGFALAKKKLPLAVTRNRVRRIGRESFRHARHNLPGLDIVVLGQPAAGQASRAELAASLSRHWQRLQHGYDDSRPRKPRPAP
ncbi:MAG: ribonuclease P protein component [Gammaproteobacteria bacterium]|jgi:ribonuclease P protein component|nr:ribonuclease P protein component [Gammaproteobacteria bacterium]